MKKYIAIFLLLACCKQLHAQPWIKRVKDIYKGETGSSPRYPHEYNGKLYFYADDSTHGYELWVSDGTEAGTQMVKDLYPGEPGGGGTTITVTNGKMYFLGTVGTPGIISICESDGTETGTKKLVDQMVYQGYLTPLNNLLIFNGGYNITTSQEVWVSDGTEAGTFPLTNFDMQTYDHTTYNNKVYFTPAEFNGPSHGPWVTDGTVAGTHKLKDIPYGREFTEYKGLLYFCGRDDNGAGQELWRTDGTEAGTVLFKDIEPGAVASVPSYFKVSNDKLFFFTIKFLTFPLYYDQLWVTDGDANNTVNILDSCLVQHSIFTFNNNIFFSADSALWVSDGTKAGTKIYNKDVYIYGSDNTAVWNNKLFFWGYKKNSTGSYDYNLYWTDGVSGDVLPVVAKPFLQRPFTGYRELIVAGNTLFFTAEKEDDSSGIELWKIVDFPANVADAATTRSQLLYPNPANNTFSVKSSNKIATVQLYSVSGKLVLTTKQTDNIDIKHLAAGLYFTHIITTDGKETIEQLIKE